MHSNDNFDVVIVGAGPSGMAAAVTLKRKGASVLLLDEQSAAGGQVYRGLEAQTNAAYVKPSNAKALVINDTQAGVDLLSALNAEQVNRCFGASVWQLDKLEDGWLVLFSVQGQSKKVHAKHVLLATGAQERACPIPGWTLPGVMTCGAAQILLKTASIAPKNAVLVGAGPLLYLLATQLIDSGAPPKALVETQAHGAKMAAIKTLPRALKNSRALFKGRSMLRQIKQAGVPRFLNAQGLSISEHAERYGHLQLRFTSDKTQAQIQTLDCQSVLLHQGVIPATHLSRSAHVQHEWNETQHAWQPSLNRWYRTSKEQLWIAGDAGGIDGAVAAIAKGQLAALDILMSLNVLKKFERNELARPFQQTLKKEAAYRPFIEHLYAPSAEFLLPANNTVVCRCEEVSAGQLRQACENGAVGLRKMKVATRAGMGHCQGRLCESSVCAIAAQFEGVSPEQIGQSSVRPPIKPIPLGELASLSESSSSKKNLASH